MHETTTKDVKRDEDGYYWVLGRADDMLNVSGHLLSTAEVESALAEHTAIAEAAAISFPHDIKGQAIFCYVVLKEDFTFTEGVKEELKYLGEFNLLTNLHFSRSLFEFNLMFAFFHNNFSSSTQNWCSGNTG